MFDDRSEEQVELILDSYRVRGELSYRGGPRRLVDIMNSVDQAYVVVRNALVDDPLRPDDEPRKFDTVQVHLSTILFALPHGYDVQHQDPLEVVRKEPIRTTISTPGFELTGYVYLIPEMQPETAQMLGMKHFTPLTECSVRSAANPEVQWNAPLVVINLARAVLFAPHSRVAAVS